MVDTWGVGGVITRRGLERMVAGMHFDRFKREIVPSQSTLMWTVTSAVSAGATRAGRKKLKPFDDIELYPVSAAMRVPKTTTITLVPTSDDSGGAWATCSHWQCSTEGVPCECLLTFAGAKLNKLSFHPRWWKATDLLCAVHQESYRGRWLPADAILYDGSTVSFVLKEVWPQLEATSPAAAASPEMTQLDVDDCGTSDAPDEDVDEEEDDSDEIDGIQPGVRQNPSEIELTVAAGRASGDLVSHSFDGENASTRRRLAVDTEVRKRAAEYAVAGRMLENAYESARSKRGRIDAGALGPVDGARMSVARTTTRSVHHSARSMIHRHAPAHSRRTDSTDDASSDDEDTMET
jgi:hypothetical protein